jgi:gamma-glutamyl phosphate reductase
MSVAAGMKKIIEANEKHVKNLERAVACKESLLKKLELSEHKEGTTVQWYGEVVAMDKEELRAQQERAKAWRKAFEAVFKTPGEVFQRGCVEHTSKP